VSLELFAVGLAGGLLGGYLAVRRWLKRGRPLPATEVSGAGSDSSPLVELQVGDVVGIATREYWLSSGYSLQEAGHALARVFHADDERLVLTFGAQGALYLGHQVSLTLPSELPARLEHLEQSFSLKSRFPVEVVPHGRESSRGTAAQWGRYEGGYEQTLWVLRTSDGAQGIVSRRVPEGDIFRWGSASAG